VVIDRGVGTHDVVGEAAGTPNAVYPTTFEGLVAVSGGDSFDVRVDPSDGTSAAEGS
jgi:hypothetical protein